MKTIRCAAAAAMLAGGAAAQETVTIDAIAFLEATGSVLRTGEQADAFAGEIRGPYFVDAGEGPVPAGEIVCVGALEADESSGRQTGEARCRLQGALGGVAYASFTCEGFRLVGCAGPFEITGGEGPMAGVTGRGPIVIRRYETTLTPTGSGVADEAALGIAHWKDFELTAAPE